MGHEVILGIVSHPDHGVGWRQGLHQPRVTGLLEPSSVQAIHLVKHGIKTFYEKIHVRLVGIAVVIWTPETTRRDSEIVSLPLQPVGEEPASFVRARAARLLNAAGTYLVGITRYRAFRIGVGYCSALIFEIVGENKNCNTEKLQYDENKVGKFDLCW